MQTVEERTIVIVTTPGALALDAIALTTNNLGKDVTVELLAQRVQISARNLSRVFVKETGFTPAKYLEQMRVESVKYYLRKTSLSFKAIAKNCGLGSADTMRKVFTRVMNVSPNNYRIHSEFLSPKTKKIIKTPYETTTIFNLIMRSFLSAAHLFTVRLLQFRFRLFRRRVLNGRYQP